MHLPNWTGENSQLCVRAAFITAALEPESGSVDT